MCVTETGSMATVCPSPHSPPLVRGGHLHAFDRRCAQHLNMKNVVFGALGRGIYISGQGRVRGGCGRVGEGGRGRGAVQVVRLAGDGPPKAPRDNI